MRKYTLIAFLLLAGCGAAQNNFCAIPSPNPSTSPSTISSSTPGLKATSTPPELIGKWALQKELHTTQGRPYEQFKNEIVEAFRKDGALPKASASLNLNGADIPMEIDKQSQAVITDERDLARQSYTFVLEADELSIIAQTSYRLSLPSDWKQVSQRQNIKEAWALLSPQKDVLISFVNEHNPPQPIALSSVLGPEAKESAWRIDVYRKQK